MLKRYEIKSIELCRVREIVFTLSASLNYLLNK